MLRNLGKSLGESSETKSEEFLSMSRGEYRVGPEYVVGAAFYMRKGSECSSSPFAHNFTRDRDSYESRATCRTRTTSRADAMFNFHERTDIFE